jgi:hypothetical protein
MPAQTVIKLRRDVAADWTSVNPVLAEGEVGLETDTGLVKYGNGTSAWTALPYPSNSNTTYLVRNNTGVTIPKGTLVAATGAEPSGRIDVAPFETTGLQDSELRVMGIATANIASGVNGTVMSFGTLTGLDTRGSTTSPLAVGDETWAAGDILYAHPTVDGKLTNVRPKHDLAIAFITVRNATAGQISIRIVPGNFHLEWLHDVELDNPTEGQVLQYDGTDWVNSAVDYSELTGVPSTFTPSAHTHPTTDIDGLTATAAELNVLDGITATTAELNHTDGVTSNIQTQLNGKAANTAATPTVQGLVLGSTGPGNASLGLNAGPGGGNSVAVGVDARRYFTSANNTAVGYWALRGVEGSSTGGSNTAIGDYSLYQLTTGSGNTAVGYLAGEDLTTGYGNFFGGKSAGSDVTTGFQNVMIGELAGSGAAAGIQKSVFLGRSAGAGASGNDIIALGYRAGQNSSGRDGISIGEDAGLSNNGTNNLAIGSSAMRNDITTGAGNVSIGAGAGSFLSTGNYNTFVGLNAAAFTDTGSNNTAIGFGVQPSTNTVSNEITLGNNQITNLRCNDTTISGLSDARDKKDVEAIEPGLDFINKLRPVKFTWEQRDGGRLDISDSGFIAQELMAVEDEYDANEWLHLTSRDNPDRYEAAPARLIPILVKAIQDLSAEVESLKGQLNG